MFANKQVLHGVLLILGIWFFYQLLPVLTPFLIAFGLAYLGNPLVERLQKKFPQLSRTVAVTIVFVLLVIIIVLLLLIIVPLLVNQIILLINKIPMYISWIQSTLLPKLESTLYVESLKMDPEAIRKALGDSFGTVGRIAKSLVTSISASTFALLSFIASFILVPMLTFYIMRDWQLILSRIELVIPRAMAPQVIRLTKASDEMLGGFLRGQFSVMLALGLIYSLGLSLVGLEFGILVGFIAGLISFIPYLGASVGITLGLALAWFQYHDFKHLVLVGIVFGVGQLLESFVLTPKLVGDKLGMHPIAVMFALMAGGNLFGFFGILLALPACAVLMVMLREMYTRYIHSRFYLG